jgi:predicted ATPase
LREALVQFLRSRPVLLLLDNCEHVLAACAGLGDDLLRACPGLQVLATSRQPLGIDGETVYAVPSLSLPAPDERPTLDRLLACEAVQLFAQRAASAQPAFGVTRATAPLVGRICQSLDGIPLAIELTAALVRTRPLELIADGLSDRFRLLVSSSTTSVPRHQTLHATVAWSHDLLDDHERALMRRLSVFAGSFGAPAAEAVCRGDYGEHDVVGTLARLVDKSLVVLDSDGRSGRYRLLETVREFGRDRLLDSGESELIRARHCEWYLALVERAGAHLFGGPLQSEWLSHLDDEHDNIRAALEWSQADNREPDASLRLVVGMWHFWEIHGYLAEGRRWLEAALAATRDVVSDVRAHGLTGAGILAYMQGDYAAAFALHEESLDLHRRLGDASSIALALSNLGNVAMELGDYARARACHEETASLQRMLGNHAEDAGASLHLAEILERQGDIAGAWAIFETTLAKLDDLAERSATPGERGFVRWLLGYGLSMYASAALRSGDLPHARQLALRALFVYRDVGDAREGARVLAQLADVTSAQGDARAATALLLEALVTRHGSGDRPGIASTLERLAEITAPIDPERAGRQLGAAEALRAQMGTPVPARDSGRHDQLRATLLTLLGPRRFEAMLEAGRQQTLAEAVADASAQANEDARPPQPPP